MKDRLFNAVCLLAGTALATLWILVLWKTLEPPPAPVGRGALMDPYPPAADRYAANELHALGKVVKEGLHELVEKLDEMKGRMDELRPRTPTKPEDE